MKELTMCSYCLFHVLELVADLYKELLLYLSFVSLNMVW